VYILSDDFRSQIKDVKREIHVYGAMKEPKPHTFPFYSPEKKNMFIKE